MLRTNSLSVLTSCFFGLVVDGRSVDNNLQFYWFQVRFPDSYLFYVILFWGDILALQNSWVQQLLILSWWSTHSWWIEIIPKPVFKWQINSGQLLAFWISCYFLDSLGWMKKTHIVTRWSGWLTTSKESKYLINQLQKMPKWIF